MVWELKFLGHQTKWITNIPCPEVSICKMSALALLLWILSEETFRPEGATGSTDYLPNTGYRITLNYSCLESSGPDKAKAKGDKKEKMNICGGLDENRGRKTWEVEGDERWSSRSVSEGHSPHVGWRSEVQQWSCKAVKKVFQSGAISHTAQTTVSSHLWLSAGEPIPFPWDIKLQQ